MGDGYEEAYAGILLVLAPGLFYNPLQIGNTAMIVEKKVKLVAMVNLVTGLINVALSFVLSGIFGVTGACISICAAYSVRDILLHYIYHTQLPLDVFAFMKNCYARMYTPLAVTLICGLVLNQFIADGGWMVFVVKGMAIVAMYLMLVFAIGLSNEERNTVVYTIKQKVIRNK